MQINLTVILLTAAFLNVSATGNSQMVTYSGKNMPLKAVFTAIEQQTGFVIFYNDDLVKDTKPVSLAVKSLPLEDFLKLCLRDQPLDYSVKNRTIVITEKIIREAPSVPVPVFIPITGVIRGPDGMPLPGVSVTIKGTGKGTMTDSKGAFSIQLSADQKVLVFSFIGMKNQEVNVTGKSVINITLEESTSKQDEVVVIGYGTSKVKDMTGSVARVTAAELEGAAPHSDIASMLQGRAAGVNVMVSSGAPGSVVAVQIRGTTSLTGTNQPLWVVDGIPQYNVNGSDIATVLYDFNINDVESIDILKDASATAIYGSRAANGVVLVTTKKGGKNLKPQVDFSYNRGVQVQRDKFRMLNTEEFKQVILDATRNAFYTTGTMPIGGPASLLDPNKIYAGMEVDYMSAPFASNAFYNGTTNWWDELTQNAIESKYDVSLRGGTPVTNYFLSVGVTDQDGIIKGSDRKAYSVRFNFDTKVGDRMKVGVQTNGAYSATNNKDAMIDKIWNFRPDFPMYDDAGRIFNLPNNTNDESPITALKNRFLTDRKGINATGFIEYKPINDLLLRSSISINYNQGLIDRYSREGTVNATHSGQANMTETESSNKVFENTATYAKTLHKHNLIALLGFVMEKGSYKTFMAGAQNFPDQDILINLSSGTVAMKPTSTYTSTALMSGLMRLNYKFDERYLATFTFRSDGSSRFGPDKRWGYFPSGAAAWIVSNEGFMKNSASVINYLKLRSSYGLSGSQVLGNNDWKTLYGSAQYNGLPGMAPSQLGNLELRWERTQSFDMGIDYALFKDRLRGSIGTYNKLTKDIIYNKGIPSSSAFVTVKENVASIRNKGVEFDIAYDLVKNKNLTVTLNFNIAHNMARAVKINGYDTVIEVFSGSAKAMRLKEGEPLNQWIGFKWSGRYYQSMEEYNLLSTQSATGAKVWYQSATSTIRPGDLRFEDVNGDGVVNDNDRVPLGSAQPKFFGGFSPSVRWKGFALQTNFVFSYGAKRYWYTNSANWYGVGLFMKNYPAYVLDSWSTDNRASAWPRMSYGQGSSNTFSDYWLSRADFLRMNMLRLNYRLPSSWMKGMLGRVDLSLSANNLFTLTNYNGIDPEGNFQGSGSISGISGIGSDYGTYPAIRSYNFTVRFSLK